ncbi:nuclear transport factor 2 family protein [Spirosoma sp. KCTC 42546]|uniref:nuclear transport factor 2 family protein n=1 Tax=Spirosoma sp. KCTC 42546 TaxID=2520506 RepID=UPI001FED5BA6|nr:nuclear transport factor 2 family protein [Spirosoma sp. KCTC 42546]
METIIVALMLALGQPTSSRQQVHNQFKTNTMETQSMQVVRTFLTAVQKGDQAKLASLIHPAIEWNQPGNNRFSGIKKSSTEVFQMVGGMFQATDNSLALTDINVLTANGNSVACLVHWKAVQPNGGILDVDNIDVYTVENGQIVKAKVYSADVAQEDNFWLK